MTWHSLLHLKDVHIKDVLKKLPGVDVDENGQVKYKGKAIDHYLWKEWT